MASRSNKSGDKRRPEELSTAKKILKYVGKKLGVSKGMAGKAAKTMKQRHEKIKKY